MEKKTRKILITNVWGGNRGDEAMINSLFAILHFICKDYQVFILRGRFETLESNTSICVIKNRIGEFYCNRVSFFIRKVFRLLNRCGLKKRFFGPLLKLVKQFSSLDMAFLREFDLIISAPQGPTISDMYTLKDKTIFPLRFAKEYGVPYMILGVSMGPFNKFTDDEIEVFKVLENAKAIIVRENISFNHLLNKYPKLNNVTAAVDIVYATGFNLQDKAPNLKETYSKFLLSLGQKEKPIGACISLTPSRDPRNKFNKLEYLAKMKAFFEYVIDKTGKNLILFPHIAFDMPALNQLKETMKNQDRVVIFPESLDSDFQQEFMSKLEFFISSRYHPTIFAIKAGVPFMCIKNQFKVEGMLNDIGLNSETCWQDESLETFIRVFNKNFDDRVTGLENIKHSLGIAKKEAKKYAEVLENYFYKSKVSTRSN